MPRWGTTKSLEMTAKKKMQAKQKKMKAKKKIDSTARANADSLRHTCKGRGEKLGKTQPKQENGWQNTGGGKINMAKRNAREVQVYR